MKNITKPKTVKGVTDTLRGEINSNLITMGEHCCRNYEKSIPNILENIMADIEIYRLERKLIDTYGE